MKVPTIAERLRAAGYVTAAFTGRGSISARYGFSKGFDRYHETERIRANDLDRIYEKTSAWLEANSQFKFFLFFHTYEVHRPNTHDVFEEAQTSRSRKVRDVAGYDSDLRYTDAYIDRLMEKLKSLGIYDESIIILLSDHGENLHDRMVEIQPIGHGYHVYDELLKVPLIFVMPGEVLRGQVVERQVSLVDVMPTILDLLSIENPDFMQGESLAPYLYGERDSSRAMPDTSMAFSEATAFGPERIALRSEGFKYIFIPDLAYDENRKMGDWDWSELDPRELFDLEADPSERNNLELGPQSAQEYRRRIREFHQRIVDFRAAGEQFVRLRDAGDEFTLDENLLENLRALGYIE